MKRKGGQGARLDGLSPPLPLATAGPELETLEFIAILAEHNAAIHIKETRCIYLIHKPF